MKLFRRLLTGIALLILVSLIILYGKGLLLSFFLIFILILVALEWQSLLRIRFPGGELTPVFLILVLLFGLFWLPANIVTDYPVVWASLILGCLFFPMPEVIRYEMQKTDSAAVNANAPSRLIAAGIFFVLPLLFYISALYIHSLSANLALLIFLMLCSVDVGGYVCGKTFGGKLLCPQVSPNKTVAGLLGGVAFCYIVYALFLVLAPHSLPPQGRGTEFILAICPIALVTQFGDLYQSVLKRASGVKDSGNLLPGHGGMFDRMDNMLFGIPLFYTFFIFVQ